MIGLIPAGGKATRIGGLPKFALPYDNDNTPILKRHVEQMTPYCEKIVISTTPQWESLIKMFNLDIELMVMTPSTMNDSLIKKAKKHFSTEYLVGMADTYFYGENPYHRLWAASKAFSVNFACWKIDDELKGRVGQVLISKNSVINMKDKEGNCNYQHMWGALSMSHAAIKSLDPRNTHPGIDLENLIHKDYISNNAHIINGEYFDIGTLSGYKKLIDKLEL
jgi:GTP:adenosylcobinamide-phosphate guanylyltransferase